MSIQSVNSSETFSDNPIQPVQNSRDEVQVERDERSSESSLPRFMAELAPHAALPVTDVVLAKTRFDQFVFDLVRATEGGNQEQIQRLLGNIPPCPKGEEGDYSDCLGCLAGALAFQGCTEEAFELIRKMPEGDEDELDDWQFSRVDFQRVAVDYILLALIKKNQFDAAFQWGSIAVKEGWMIQDLMLDAVHIGICVKYYMEKNLDQLGQYLDSIPPERFVQKSPMWFFMPLFLVVSGRKDKIHAYIERIDEECRSLACRGLLEEGFIEEARLFWEQVTDPEELHNIQVTYCATLARMGKEEEAAQLIEKMPMTAVHEEYPELGSIQESALARMFMHLFRAGLKEKAFSILNNRITNQKMKVQCLEFACQRLAEKGEIQEAYDLAVQSSDPLNIDRITEVVCRCGSKDDLEVLEKLLSTGEEFQWLHARVLVELQLARGQLEDALKTEDLNLDGFCESFERSLERRHCGKILHY